MALVNEAPAGEDGAPVEFTHDTPGTPERAWRDWPVLRDVPALDWTGIEHVLVLAAHPDDETLGAGGLIATAAARGLPVDVVVATDGEGSHPRSTTTTPAALADVRAGEVRRAVGTLAPGATLHRLRVPDGAVRAGADVVEARLAGLIRPASLVVAPWTGDAHPDHEAAGHVAVQVAAQQEARCLLYPVWAWHWAHPGDGRIPWQQGVRLPLTPAVHRAKQTAMSTHVSQTGALSPEPGDEVLLSADVLAHFTRDAEFFLAPAPAVDGGSLGASFFEEFYAENGEDPWGFEDRWYEQRKRALTLAALPRARFASALEIGCSAGAATVELAPRCDRLLAVDIAESALLRARERLAGAANVQTRVCRVPQEFPDGEFDLVVLSEVGYYCDPQDLEDLVARIRGALTPDGVVVACHWRHLVQGYPLTGDAVHRALRREFDLLAHHEEEDFLLDVLVPAPAVSVARSAGLLG